MALATVAAATTRERPRVTLATASRYQLNQLRYQHDPVGWIDAFVRFPPGEQLAEYQREIIGRVGQVPRVTARGPHGLGKSALASLVILWYATTRDGLDWKVVTTASNWRQLSKYLWPEVHKWVRHVDWDKLGMPRPRDNRELQTMALKLRTGEAFAVASDQPWAIEGAHADHLLYVFDEAKAIPSATWDAAEGAFSGAGSDTGREALALAISTPGVGQSRFREIHERKGGFEDWWTRRVTLDEAIRAGRISRQWADQRRHQWGEGSVLYTTRVKGEFANQDEDGVIPVEWIQAAMDRWQARADAGELASAEVTMIGADIGDGGADPSVVGRQAGITLIDLEEVPQAKGELMRVAGRVKQMADAHKCPTVVDADGVGSGVAGRLREQGVRVIAFHAGEASTGTDRSRELSFANLRAEAWWMMREALDPDGGDDIALPPGDRLMGDLAAPRWYPRSNGQIVIEGKDDKRDEDGSNRRGIRSRLKRSTDYGDVAVMLNWARRKRPTGALKLTPAWGGR